MFLIQTHHIYMYQLPTVAYLHLHFLAYVCGENSGLFLEKPFTMGQTLSGDTKLDINVEFELMKQKLKELQHQDFSEQEISQSMKDLGMARFAA